jgi:hypothetical protein
MCPVIDNSTSCKIGRVIHFFHAKNASAVKIHRELCVVYGQNVMSEGDVRQWCRMFRDGRTNVHNDQQSGWPSVVSDTRVLRAGQKVCEGWHFTISELLCEFPHILPTVLYKIITDTLGCHKFCTSWVLKMLTGAHKMQRMASALTFLE